MLKILAILLQRHDFQAPALESGGQAKNLKSGVKPTMSWNCLLATCSSESACPEFEHLLDVGRCVLICKAFQQQSKAEFKSILKQTLAGL